jgi:hypothetical protein
MGIRNFKSAAKILFLDIRNIGGTFPPFLPTQVTPRVAALLPRKHGFAATSALVGFVVEKAGFEQLSV